MKRDSISISQPTNECIPDPDIRRLVKGIGKVVRQTETEILDENGNVSEVIKTEQIVYYVSSRRMDVRAFAGYVRRHWEIESRHWIFDNLFQEDRCRARKENARMNTSLMCKLAYDILLLERIKKPKDRSFEYLQDELKFDLPTIARYFLLPMEKLS